MSRKITTKIEIHQAFEAVIKDHGPQTCKKLVEIVNDVYTITRVSIHKKRAAQYLIMNPNIVIVGDVRLEGKVHVYGLRGVEYSQQELQTAVNYPHHHLQMVEA